MNYIGSQKKDVRDIQLETRIELMNQVHQEANDHDNIISVQCGWSDEHIHTELLTSEGMDRTWSFQRIMTNVMVTARDEQEVVSYRMRHGGRWS